MAEITLADALRLAEQELSAGRIDNAESIYRQIIQLAPANPHALASLGSISFQKRNITESIEFLKRASHVAPDWPEVHFNLSIACRKRDPELAIRSLEQAIKLKPDWLEPRMDLGATLADAGEIDSAIAAFRAGLAINPGHPGLLTNLLYSLHFDPAITPEDLYREHLAYDRYIGPPNASKIRPLSNAIDPDRRLRIGYVSPDLWDHPVGRFILPLLEKRNQSAFSVTCFSSNTRSDEITSRIRSVSDVFRVVTSMTDDALAEQIRKDQIDILVDLSLHTHASRLAVFAQKPSPIQMTYLAYCSTSGLRAIDYRISDPYLDEARPDEGRFTETTLRLPRTYWCYVPTSDTPEIVDAPSLKLGQITFGCLNAFRKVTLFTLQLWARVLSSVDGSRLLLHAPQGQCRERIHRFFKSQGIDESRIVFKEKVTRAEYFQLHQQIDIALDPFPYGGGTTSCDALWMGVPVITLAGRTGVSRAGLSILSNLQMMDMVAKTPDEYVQIAASLAGDTGKLNLLRRALRERLIRSPIMDSDSFAHDMEALYRAAWKRFCSAGK